MRPPRLSRIRSTAALVSAVLLASSCGSSATSVTSPSTISRCAITVQAMDREIPAQGGSGSITVGAARDCTWTATSEAQWLSIRSNANGQGDGTVEFAAATNPDPTIRRGAVVLNGQRAEVVQAAAACAFSLAQSSARFGQNGGSGTIELSASSALCAWTAASDADWITVRTASGTGSAQVAFQVQATTGPPRSGTVTAAGQKFSITQSEGCSFTITPTTHTAPQAGGTGSIAIGTTAGCPWTASSNVDWLTLGQSSGAGPGTVSFTVAPTSGPARTGTAIVAGEVFSVTQSQGCAYHVEPAAHAVGAGGGAISVGVTSASGCAWTAASDVPWVTIQSGAAGTGSGTVSMSVQATSGPARTGTATVAGQRVTITQAPGCAFTISPETASVGAAGGTGRVTVTAAAGCAWTASSSASWLTITSGASGSGNGEVQYRAASTAGPGRSATLTVAGRTFTLTQGQGCSFALSSTSATIDDAGGTGSFNVQAGAGCEWRAASTVPWVTITAGATGSGDGQVRFSVGANNGPSRSGAITAGGQTFTVQQGNGCSYSLSSPGQNVPAGGGSGTVNVTAGGACTWTATSNAGWLSVTSGASGTGNGTVGFSAAAHAGPARSGTLTIGGRTFTVSQAGGCSFSIAPEQASIAAGGGPLGVTVSSTAGCTWNASSDVPWMRVTSGSPGNGNGTVQLAVDPHAGAPRSGTATIAGRTFTVNQAAGCTFAINPSAQTVGPGAGSVAVSVSAPDGCAWSSSSNAGWLSIASGGAGSGNGSVQVDVQPNSGAGRTGTVTIAGQTLTITQDSGCTFTVAPETIAAPAAGAAPRVDVSAAASCAWTATSGAPWISITAGASGTGNGAADLAIQANTGPARSGTATIAGRTVTVNQDSGCTYSLSASAQPMPTGGGAGSVTVTAGGGCTWTATSNAAWIQVTGGTPGTGNGSVQFNVDANATGAPRSGTITIAGLTFTVNQD